MSKNLEKIILELQNEKEVKRFLKGILTTKEYTDILTRLKIVRMLRKGLPHQEIAQKLGVGVATVTRGSKALQNGDFDILEKLDK